jgi:hypothetical protein
MGCLKILHHIGEIISSAPTCMSFRLWIEVLSEADFNDIVRYSCLTLVPNPR